METKMHQKQGDSNRTFHQVKGVDETHVHDGGSFDAVTGSKRTSRPKLSLQTQPLTTVDEEDRSGRISDTTPNLLASSTSQCSQASRYFKTRHKFDIPQSQSDKGRTTTPKRAENWNRRLSTCVKNEAGQGRNQVSSQAVQPNVQTDSYQISLATRIGLVTATDSFSAPSPRKSTIQAENMYHCPRSAIATCYSDLSDKSNTTNLSGPFTRQSCGKDFRGNLQGNRNKHQECPHFFQKSETYSPYRDFLDQTNPDSSDNTDPLYSQSVLQNASDSLSTNVAIKDSTNFGEQWKSSNLSRESSATSSVPHGHRRLLSQDNILRSNESSFPDSPHSNSRVENLNSTPLATVHSNVRGTTQNTIQEGDYVDLSIRPQTNISSCHSGSTTTSAHADENFRNIFISSRNNGGSITPSALRTRGRYLSHPLSRTDSGWVSHSVSHQGSLFPPRKCSLLRDWCEPVPLEQIAKGYARFEIQPDQENETSASLSASKTSTRCISKNLVQLLPSNSPVSSTDINSFGFLHTGRLEPRAHLPLAIKNEGRSSRQNSFELDPLDAGIGKLESSLGSKMDEVGAATENDDNVILEQNKYRYYALCCNYIPQSLKARLISNGIQWTSKGAFEIHSSINSRRQSRPRSSFQDEQGRHESDSGSLSIRSEPTSPPKIVSQNPWASETTSVGVRRISSLPCGAAITSFRRYYRSHKGIIAASKRDAEETPEERIAKQWADVRALRRQFGSLAGRVEVDLGF